MLKAKRLTNENQVNLTENIHNEMDLFFVAFKAPME